MIAARDDSTSLISVTAPADDSAHLPLALGQRRLTAPVSLDSITDP